MKSMQVNFWGARDKVMPEMHLRQPGFAYGACEPFAKKENRT